MIDHAAARQPFGAVQIGVGDERPTLARHMVVADETCIADQNPLVGQMETVLHEKRAVVQRVGLISVACGHRARRTLQTVDPIKMVERIFRSLAQQILTLK